MKSFIKNLSIKWKVLFGAFAVFFFTIFISDGTFLFTIYRTLSYRNYLSNERLANVLASEINYPLSSNKIIFIKRYLGSNIKNYGIIDGIGLYDTKGKLIMNQGKFFNKRFLINFAHKRNNNTPGLFNNLKNLAAWFTLLGSPFHGYQAGGEDRVLIRNIRYGGKNLGFVAIKFNLRKEMKDTDSRVFWVGVRFSIIAAIFIGLGLFMFYYITVLITRPLSEIKENIEKIKGGDYKISFKSSLNDEIGSVINAIGSMALSIDEYTKKINLINKEKNELNCMAIMGELSANIAHEVKNAIYIISSANAYISQETKNKIVLEFTGIINKEVERLNKKAVDFLSFARQRNPELIFVDINKLIGDSVKILKFEADNLKIKIIQKLGDDIAFIKGDPELLKQVIINLIINAMDKTYETKNKLIEIRTFLEYGSVIIEISDNGEAIPQENIEKIFTPFFTTKNTGSGLGLPISMRIIKLHKGTINVRSKGGKTVFTILIPMPTDENMPL
ncbi:MAG: ATP-binding protein [bacterium]